MIKIAITADLHYPITSVTKIQEMIGMMRAEIPDIAILGGDIAETRIDVDYFEYVINMFTNVFSRIPVLVLSGNHDLWVSDVSQYTSLDLWKKELRSLGFQE